MRSFFTAPLNLAVWLGGHKRNSKVSYWGLSITILTIVLAIDSIVIQFSSTILLSDLLTGTTPGFVQTKSIRYDYEYLPGGIYQNLLSMPQIASWFMRPSFFPAFAEYTEQPLIQENVSDTGLTLRAFFPMSSANDRVRIYNFTGKAYVLDSRVSCQAPLLDNVTFSGSLHGHISPSVIVPRLYLLNSSTSFSCPVATLANLTDLLPAEQWPLTFCSITDPPYTNGTVGSSFSGGLMSEFSTYPPGGDTDALSSNGRAGMSFLFVNATISVETPEPTDVNPTEGFNTALTSTSMEAHDEWVDVIFEDGSMLSASLCYAAFDTADLDIQASGASNRTEPVPGFDPVSNSLTFTEVTKQLSQASNLSHTQRNILQLQRKDSWIPSPSDDRPDDSLPFAVSLASYLFLGLTGQISHQLWDGGYSGRCNLDDAYCNLFQAVLNSGGEKKSVALALQAIITATTSMLYYEQLPTFSKVENSSQVFFEETLVPIKHRGFSLLVSVVVVHLILVGIISVLFYRSTRVSMLGNVWQVVSQLTSENEDLKSVFATTSMMQDKEVKRLLQDTGTLRRRVGLSPLDDGRSIGIVHR
ncbi:hypothetical protein EG329_003823 [Mollisiaceae sp. DMI_Dod_QoI]|nr:hypothetical protein EG329_003823 [Helotiales sp. DMI_Dod_QoI]